MVVCKFFMEGYCKFGARCKFDHADHYGGYDSPRSGDYSSERRQGTSILKAASSSFGGQEYAHSPEHSFVQPQQHGFGQQSFSQTPQQSFSQTPQQSFSQTPQQSFGQTPQHSFNQTPQHGFNSPLQQGSFAQKPSGLKYNVQEMMQIVLRDIAQLEKGGQWQLSSYSPLKELPNLPGLDDYSPEELRWECYKALQNGSLPLCQVIVQQLYGNVAKINNELKRKDSGYSIIDRWLRDSEQRIAQNRVEPAPAFSSPFGGSSGPATSLSSSFFTSEPQVQQPQPPPQQSAAVSFSFNLSSQQPPANALPFQQNSSVFPSGQTSAFVSSSQTSAFAPSNQTSPFITQTQVVSQVTAPHRDQVDSSQVGLYSSSEALTEDELRAFQANRFVLGAIPTKPPPRALC